MRAIDLTGKQFGKLTVLREDGHASCGKRQWLCKCACGNIVTVIGGNLTKGSSTSCGCSKTADIEGRVFGNLTAIKPTASRDNNGNIVWECLCSCGESVLVGVSDLTCGKVRSCGCLLRSTLDGMRFGRLTVLSFSHISSGRSQWRCRCDCGTICTIPGHELRSGDTKSCGCLRDELASKRMRTHGMSKTRIYRIWKQMLQRCENPNDSSYPEYGLRGVTVCEEWHHFPSFKSWADSTGYADNLSLDRVNPFHGYAPLNCRWANDVQQGSNKRRSYFAVVDRYYQQHLVSCVSSANRQYVKEFWELICTENYWSQIFGRTSYTMLDVDSSKELHDFIYTYIEIYLSFLDWAFCRFVNGYTGPFTATCLNILRIVQPPLSYDVFLHDLDFCIKTVRGD